MLHSIHSSMLRDYPLLKAGAGIQWISHGAHLSRELTICISSLEGTAGREQLHHLPSRRCFSPGLRIYIWLLDKKLTLKGLHSRSNQAAYKLALTF